jgi:hypothetical protein
MAATRSNADKPLQHAGWQGTESRCGVICRKTDARGITHDSRLMFNTFVMIGNIATSKISE